MTNINEIIKIEEMLLKIDNSCKFNLTLYQNIRLSDYLEKIGKMTNIYFELQNDYYKLNGEEMFKEYHNKLVSEELFIDIEPFKMFIDELSITLYDNELFKEIYLLRFW